MYSSVVVQEVLQNFETRALKMRSSVADHQKLTVTNWEPSSKLILLKIHEKLPMNSVLTILWLCVIWSKLERWRSLISESHELTANEISHCCEALSSQPMQQWTISRSHCDVWWKGFYLTSSYDQLSGWTKKKLQITTQSQTCTDKRSRSLFGNLLPIWSSVDFWIPMKTLHLRSMLSK